MSKKRTNQSASAQAPKPGLATSPDALAPTASSGGTQNETAQSAPEVLLGSSVQPALIDIGGKQIQLGTVVAEAHAASRMSVADWNALDPEVRESLLQDQIDMMREDAAAADKGGAGDPNPGKPEQAQSLYPRKVTLRNNGGIAIGCPVTGAYLMAGGAAVVTIHDEAQASRLRDNFEHLAAINHLGNALVIEGLPETE